MDSEKASRSSLGSVICLLVGHRFRVSNRVTPHIREYKCSCCGSEVTDTVSGELAKLTPQFRETNSFLAQFHKRRKNRFYSSAS